MPKSHEVSRKDFVMVVTAFVGSVIGAVIGLPAIGYLIAPAAQTKKTEAWIPLGPLENFPEGVPTLASFVRTKVNGWEKTSNSYGVYVLREAGEQVKALSNVCTHLSCRVTWDAEAKQYHCPCHDAAFNINGEVTGGPPPRPLNGYEVKVEEGNVSIFFQEG
jgi:menaquinol-cytochrome c reductase iron-sulfur subunit